MFFSEWKFLHAGVPQGSIFGPLLFLIFINDIADNITSNIRLFADDTMIYLTIEDANQTAQILNNDLEKINQWSKKWLVTFNADKTESILFSRKQKPTNFPDLYLNTTKIERFQKHKHLGIVLSHDCKWKERINYIIPKANFKLLTLSRLKHLLEQHYKTFTTHT